MGRAARRPRGPAGTPASPAPVSSAAVTPRWVWAGLAALVALAYANALPRGLAVDAPFLLSNPRLASPNAANVWLILTKPYWWPAHADDLYRPVTTLSFFLRAGAGALVPHLVNVALHALNVALAFLLARRVNGGVVAAALVAALFAVHPIGADTVTNIAGRADLLAAAAVLGGTLLHRRAIEGPRAERGRWLGLLALVALLGVFSKENAVVLLPVLVLYDVAFGERRGSLVESLRAAWHAGRVSYLVIALVLAVLGIVRGAVLSDEAPHWPPFVDNPLAGAGFVASRLTAAQAFGYGVGLLVWPAALSADYSYDQIPVIGVDAPALARFGALGSLALLIAAAFAAWRVRATRPAFFFWTFFFLGTRLPTANFMLLIGSIFAERFLYLPAIGFAGALVALVPAPAPRFRGVLVAAAGAILVALSVRTIARNRDWHDDEAVWRAAIRDCPDSYKPYKGLARVRRAAGALDEALTLGERSLAVLDKRPLPLVDQSSDLLLGLGEDHLAKGDALRAAGHAEDARLSYTRARAVLARAASVDRATNERVRTLRAARGEAEPAITDVGMTKIHETLGAAALRLGDVDGARAAFDWYRHLDPTHEGAYLKLAEAARAAGRADEEIALLVEAMVVAPDSAAVWSALGPAAQRANLHGLALEGGRPRIDPADPALAAVVARACPDLIAGLSRARRAAAAADVEAICRRNLGYR
jgi:tetratricopeptide (TPR) repeat protein